jgi:hypothetical protein
VKPLLVGEANPFMSSGPFYALYPEPEHSTGDRLRRLIMGIPAAQYLRDFDRVNLCPHRWSMHEAREHAERIRAGEDRLVVLLGRKVCEAFDIKDPPLTVVDNRFVLLPHPSGLNRHWNVPGNFARARAFLVEAGVLPPELREEA